MLYCPHAQALTRIISVNSGMDPARVEFSPSYYGLYGEHMVGDTSTVMYDAHQWSESMQWVSASSILALVPSIMPALCAAVTIVMTLLLLLPIFWMLWEVVDFRG